MFGQGEMQRALTRLGEIAWGAQRIIDMAVYGGSAIVLAWGFRVATKDVDAVVRGDPSFLRRAVRQVAEEEGWPRVALGVEEIVNELSQDTRDKASR